MYEYKQTPDLDLEVLESPTGENFVYGETLCKVHVFFIYRRPTLYPLEIAVDFLKSL